MVNRKKEAEMTGMTELVAQNFKFILSIPKNLKVNMKRYGSFKR